MYVWNDIPHCCHLIKHSLTTAFSLIFLVELQFDISQAPFQLIVVTWEYRTMLRKPQTFFFSSVIFVAHSILHAFE